MGLAIKGGSPVDHLEFAGTVDDLGVDVMIWDGS